MTSTSMKTGLSVNLNREMRWAQRHQKILRVEDVAGGEGTRPLGVPGDDTLSRLHDNGRGDRVDISPSRHRTTFRVSRARDHFDEERLG